MIGAIGREVQNYLAAVDLLPSTIFSPMVIVMRSYPTARRPLYSFRVGGTRAAAVAIDGTMWLYTARRGRARAEMRPAPPGGGWGALMPPTPPRAGTGGPRA